MKRFLVGLLATLGLLTLLLVIGGGAAAAWFLRGGHGHALPDQILLLADLREELPEARATGGLSGFGLDHRLTLSDAVLALDAAARDPRVKGVLAQVDDTRHGIAVAQELRQAVARFRAGGKFAIAHADTFGELASGTEGYYLATAFERIELQPAGLVGLTGIAAEMPFVGKLLGDLGVDVEVNRREEYKTALEPFSRAEISPENREMLEDIVGRYADQLKAGVAEGRHLEPAVAERLFGGGPYTAAEAQSAGLIDAVEHYDDTLRTAFARAGQGAGTVSLADYWQAQPVAAGSAPHVALIRGVGLIRRGEGGLGSGIAADAMAAALSDAVSDDEVKAILLRLDTGGGSAVASETIAYQVRRAIKAGKPVVVSMGNTAGSGGYWLAVEGTVILADPATLTGSIGVVAAKPVLDRLWQRLGVTWTAIGRGENAGMMSLNTPYSPAERARVEALLDSLYGDFKANVARARKLDPARVEELAKGRVWLGSEAAELGLVDRLGGIHEALDAVREALKLPADAALALEPLPRPKSPLAQVAGLLNGGLDGLGTLTSVLTTLSASSGPLGMAPVMVR